MNRFDVPEDVFINGEGELCTAQWHYCADPRKPIQFIVAIV